MGRNCGSDKDFEQLVSAELPFSGLRARNGPKVAVTIVSYAEQVCQRTAHCPATDQLRRGEID